MFLASRAPSVSRLSKQCGTLNISQPYRPPRPVTGIALLYFILEGEDIWKYRDQVKTIVRSGMILVPALSLLLAWNLEAYFRRKY
jgi:hypothetical protein